VPNAENDHGPAESTGSAFTRLLDGIVALRDLDATWLTVAGELLRFAEENMPPASSWAGLAPGQPDGTVVLVSAVTQAALATITREVSEGSKLSFATEEERETLRSVALAQLAEAPFDRAMNEATTAIGIAEAIDDLTGHTFMPWYKGEGELTVGGGLSIRFASMIRADGSEKIRPIHALVTCQAGSCRARHVCRWRARISRHSATCSISIRGTSSVIWEPTKTSSLR
jgi:hypothetical protein